MLKEVKTDTSLTDQISLQELETGLTPTEVEELFQLYQELYGQEEAARMIKLKLGRNKGLPGIYHKQILESERQLHPQEANQVAWHLLARSDEQSNTLDLVRNILVSQKHLPADAGKNSADDIIDGILLDGAQELNSKWGLVYAWRWFHRQQDRYAQQQQRLSQAKSKTSHISLKFPPRTFSEESAIERAFLQFDQQQLLTKKIQACNTAISVLDKKLLTF